MTFTGIALKKKLMNDSTTRRQNGICMVGVFPPPVHGMANLNAAMRRLIADRGVTPLVVDLAADSLLRTWFHRLRRIGRVMKGLLRYSAEVLARRNQTLYMSLSGGLGQIYELLFACIARVSGRRIFLHHHSYAYVDQRKLLTQFLVRVAGPECTHLVGCEVMGEKLRQRYPVVSITSVASNSNLLGTSGTSQKSRARRRLANIAFIGNISVEKGIAEFIAVAERLKDEMGLQFHIAGPFETGEAEKLVQEATVRLRKLKYHGPRYGAEKEAFWDMTDAFLFPSKYFNETAPVVVYEAMERGIPVIAWNRGCVSSIVRGGAGQVIERNLDFSPVAVALLLQWQRDPNAFFQASNAAATEFARQQAWYQQNMDVLLNQLCGGPSTSFGTPLTAQSRPF